MAKVQSPLPGQWCLPVCIGSDLKASSPAEPTEALYLVLSEPREAAHRDCTAGPARRASGELCGYIP